MTLKEFIKAKLADSCTPEGWLSSFADACGTTVGQLKHVASGNRRAGESLAINIERESDGVVLCETLRPDVDWAYLRGSVSQQDKAA